MTTTCHSEVSVRQLRSPQPVAEAPGTGTGEAAETINILRRRAAESCFYFVGSAARGRCARCGDSYRPHVDRAARQPFTPRPVPADDDEDTP